MGSPILGWFEISVVTDLHFDRFGFCDLFLGKCHGQDAILEIRPNVLGFDALRYREISYERTVAALQAMEALVALFARELPLSLYGEGAVLELDVDVFLFDSRNIRLQN